MNGHHWNFTGAFRANNLHSCQHNKRLALAKASIIRNATPFPRYAGHLRSAGRSSGGRTLSEKAVFVNPACQSDKQRKARDWKPRGDCRFGILIRSLRWSTLLAWTPAAWNLGSSSAFATGSAGIFPRSTELPAALRGRFRGPKSRTRQTLCTMPSARSGSPPTTRVAPVVSPRTRTRLTRRDCEPKKRCRCIRTSGVAPCSAWISPRSSVPFGFSAGRRAGDFSLRPRSGLLLPTRSGLMLAVPISAVAQVGRCGFPALKAREGQSGP